MFYVSFLALPSKRCCKSTLRRLVLRNEAQRDTVCWASQAQHQPTIHSFTTLLLGREGFILSAQKSQNLFLNILFINHYTLRNLFTKQIID